MNLRNPNTQRAWAIAAVAAALLSLGVGAFKEYKVYDAEVEEFGIVAFSRIGERDLTIDATFGGVKRNGEKLYTTYDRTAQRGKRACPT